MGQHRIFFPDLDPETGQCFQVTGPEAHHALRVKRLSVGDSLEVLNGLGVRVLATIEDATKVAAGKGRQEWVLSLRVRSSTTEARTRPSLHVVACAPKLTRVEDMVDQLSQVGASAWSPLVTQHTIAPPRAGKMDKLERVASEASKQCGRAWLMQVGNPVGLERVLSRRHDAAPPEARLVIADPEGEAYVADGSAQISLLIGPEAGFTPDEVEAAQAAGASVCRIGPHLMRVGTAAVVASGIILDAEHARSAAAGL